MTEPDRITKRPNYMIPDIKEVPIKIPTRGKYNTSNGKPLGCVVHFTAGRFAKGEQDAINTLQYLASQGLGCLVMSTEGIIYKAQDWDQWAYHAGTSSWQGKTGISQYCMGMEICNVGLLEKKGDKYFSWFGQDMTGYPMREAREDHENIKKGMYHCYTPEQEEALINFLLWRMDTQGLDPDWVVGHDECAPTRKWDPGASLSMSMPSLRSYLKGFKLNNDVSPDAYEGEPKVSLLSIGSQGLEVKKLQEALSAFSLRFHPGAPDGVFGPRTKQALMAFQEIKGLPVDGVTDEDVWAALK